MRPRSSCVPRRVRCCRAGVVGGPKTPAGASSPCLGCPRAASAGIVGLRRRCGGPEGLAPPAVWSPRGESSESRSGSAFSLRPPEGGWDVRARPLSRGSRGSLPPVACVPHPRVLSAGKSREVAPRSFLASPLPPSRGRDSSGRLGRRLPPPKSGVLRSRRPIGLLKKTVFRPNMASVLSVATSPFPREGRQGRSEDRSCALPVVRRLLPSV